MRLLLIDDNYPSEDNLYGDVFAHVRVKEYIKAFSQIIVAASLSTKKPDYIYEGVKVKSVGSIHGLIDLMENYKPNVVLIHFATFPIIRKIIFRYDLPYIIWVHGFEALGWYRRLFNFKSIVHFLKYIKGNVIQLYYFRKLVKRSNKGANIHFVFISNWMRKIAEADCLIRVKKYSIIPNPINNELFSPEEKQTELRKRILMIRPFYSKKYGTDIVTKAMKILKTKPFFNELHFTIYGKGSTKSELSKFFDDDDGVVVRDGFLTQGNIRKLHQEHGIFLSITRQDAQGVSMCEAMSSGLVVITSDNTAIPEFVEHNRSGILTDNQPQTVATAIEYLYHNPEKFQKIGKNASDSIITKSGIEMVIRQETDLIRRAIKTIDRKTTSF